MMKKCLFAILATVWIGLASAASELTAEEKQLAALLEELLTEEAKLQELSRCAKERADQFDDRAYRDKILQIAGLSKM